MRARVSTKLHQCRIKNCPINGKLKVQITYEDGEVDYPILLDNGHISSDFPDRLNQELISKLRERFAFVEKQNRDAIYEKEELRPLG